MNLPEAFLARMKKQLGAEYDAFVASYDADTSYGLRLNLLKGTVDEIIPVLPFALTNVPWIPEGFHVSSTERPGKHILHEAGAYYIQDPSAMSVITLLDPMPGERLPAAKVPGLLPVCRDRGCSFPMRSFPAERKSYLKMWNEWALPMHWSVTNLRNVLPRISRSFLIVS